MRIVHLAANLEVGGLERQVIELAYQQIQSGHETSIYCLMEEGALACEARSRGIPVVSFDKPAGLSCFTAKRLTVQLLRDGPHVLHTHNAVVHHYGVVAATLARIPRVINTQHGTATLMQDRRLARIFSATMPWTDAVVMVSEKVRSCLVRKAGIPSRKTRVITNGILLPAFQNFRANPGSQRPKIRFGTVGRLAAVKDHRTLIQAFRDVLKAIPCAELHIAGDGPLRTELSSQIAALGLSAKIHLHGSRNDIGNFLSDLDIFVLSSLSEGVPMALLEASAVGLPVVSTNVGGIPEVSSAETTEYCEPARPAAMADAMLRMARRPDLAAVGAMARDQADAHGIDGTWRQYRELLQSLNGIPSA